MLPAAWVDYLKKEKKKWRRERVDVNQRLCRASAANSHTRNGNSKSRYNDAKNGSVNDDVAVVIISFSFFMHKVVSTVRILSLECRGGSTVWWFAYYIAACIFYLDSCDWVWIRWCWRGKRLWVTGPPDCNRVAIAAPWRYQTRSDRWNCCRRTLRRHLVVSPIPRSRRSQSSGKKKKKKRVKSSWKIEMIEDHEKKEKRTIIWPVFSQ